MLLTARDEDIMRVLSLKLRLLTLSQVAEIWWTPSALGLAAARRRLAALRQAGLAVLRYVQARPLPEIDAPLFSWHPGQSSPDYGPLAWKLQRRWTAAPRRTAVLLATRRGANQFGGRGGGIVKQHFQASHDLGVSQMYVVLRRLRPEQAKRWVGEDLLSYLRRSRKSREKIPDAAILADGTQDIDRILEFGGAYDAARLRRFHRDCSRRELPYELW